MVVKQHDNTVKVHIGITPQGTISYVLEYGIACAFPVSNIYKKLHMYLKQPWAPKVSTQYFNHFLLALLHLILKSKWDLSNLIYSFFQSGF